MSFSAYLLISIIPLFFCHAKWRQTSAILSLLWLIPIFAASLGIWHFSTNHPFVWSHLLDIRLTFHIDGLSRLFLTLISGIGILIFCYAISYFYGQWEKLARLVFILQLFTVSMVGIVTSNNLIILFCFWEMTTLTSYLLVQFDYTDAQARQASFNGMFLSVFGALFMLVGLILLHLSFGTWDVSSMIQQISVNHGILNHPQMSWAFFLILLGAMTKSAQFPFHFWLTGAMKAPTPVSAFLHSATMVNAGVYLLARLHPIFDHNAFWYPSLVTVGLVTMSIAGILSLLYRDLKSILAYTTIFSLGVMFNLLSGSSSAVIEALVVFIFIHALYKAALFMMTGILDKQYQTRDIDALKGAGRHHIGIGIVAIVGCLTMAGMPPFFGFVSKSLIYEAKLAYSDWLSVILTIISVLSSIAIAIASFKILLTLWKKPDPHANIKPAYPNKMRNAFWLPLLLALAILISSFIPSSIGAMWIKPATLSILPSHHEIGIQAFSWASLGMAEWICFGIIFGGLLGYWAFKWIKRFFQKIHFVQWINTQWGFEKGFDQFLLLSKKITNGSQEHSITTHVQTLFITVIILMGLTLIPGYHSIWPKADALFAQWSWLDIGFSSMIVISLIALIFSREFLMMMISFGIIGLALTGIFLYHGTMDVAMTQLLVEVLTVIIAVIAFMRTDFSKQLALRLPASQQLFKAIIAGAIGLIVMVLLTLVVYRPFDPTLKNFFLQNSLPLGHGRNVVNVILVDFRSLDTFGEVIVVFGAAVGIWTLFKAVKYRNVSLNYRYRFQKSMLKSIILATSVRIIIQIMMIVSLLLLLRGHDHPGGGFIGALTAISAIAVYTLAYRINSSALVRLLPAVISVGLLCLLLGLVLGPLVGKPLLTGQWLETRFLGLNIKIGSFLLFDVGVYLVILGAIAWLIAEIEGIQQ